ncbi:uncharacterized protein LOC123004618 [Tribolium madens]|uniref:uncharacterized protein LOC123004618 n=1 Tax=Tribolium madens TaxID=41895 RepID=UPI001CF75014|nr:uncharacterized protein LOC123004618 [Tribolium madens]
MKLQFFIALTLTLAKAENPDSAVQALKQESGLSWVFPNPGVVQMQYRANLVKNLDHEVDGSVILEKNLLGGDPVAVGGGIHYSHTPSKVNFGVQAVHGAQGTQFGAQATRKVYQGGNNAVDVGVVYGQHFGGPGGNSRPVVGAVVKTTL